MSYAPDFSVERGISKATLELFNVRNNGTGWLWDTKRLNGAVASRWKSYYSTSEQAPESERQTWKKYAWHPEKPTDAKYFYPPKLSLTKAIADNFGVLWLVGGEVAAMSMIDAGITNVISFFGDTNIPHSLAADLESWGVQILNMIPDRDKSGLECAVNVRDELKLTDIKFDAFELPYPLDDKHGKDVNDYWKLCAFDKERFNSGVMLLVSWSLPEYKPATFPTYDISNYLDTDLPEAFIYDIERSLDVYPYFNADGWSKRNVKCPFHGDENPSATWNHQKSILYCHSGCGKTYLAKDVGAKFGIELKNYASIPYVKAVESDMPKAQAKTEQKTTEEPKSPKANLRPDLPLGIELTPAQVAKAKDGRKWLDDCLKWAVDSCPLAPEIFHESMALWLLASVATRRMKITIGGEDIYPNLYIMIIAKTTLYHKSTALNNFRKLVKAARLEPLLLPIDVTPEALFDELAGIKPMNFDSLPHDEQQNWLLGRAIAAQRSIIKDEASSILASLKKDYNAGLSELLLQGYDGDTGTLRKLLKTKGLIVVKDMCISFLGATTPIMYSKYMSNEESENGFIARFAMITPDCVPVYRHPSDNVEIPNSLISGLRRFFTDTLPWHKGQKPSAPQYLGEVVSPPVMSVTIDPEALAHLNAYRKALGYDMLLSGAADEHKAANYARLGTMAFKVAMLLAGVDTTEGQVKIGIEHAYAAQQICERWRESLYRLDRDVASSGDRREDRVLSYLKSAGSEGVTIREIIRDCGIKEGKPKALEFLNVLADEGLVEMYDKKPEGAGRPSKKYRIVPCDVKT